MRTHPQCSILAFFPAGEGDPQAAYQAVREGRKGRPYLFPSASSPPKGRPIERFSALRFDDEVLLSVEAQLSDVEGIVKRLQTEGSPAVFVLDENPAEESPNLADTSIFARLDQNAVALDVAHRDLAEAVRLGHALTAAGEWMLDNAYLVRTQIAEIRRDLPRRYVRDLSALAPGYARAKELVARVDHSVNADNISDWLRECQTGHPLTIAELWLFPLLLRIALVDALRVLASRISRAQQFREAACLWANRLAAGCRRGPDLLAHILKRMESESISREPYFLTSLVEQLHDEDDVLAPLQAWMEQRLNIPLSELVRNEHTQEAAERVSTANAFGSLRVLPRIDFTKIFEAVSLVEHALRADPAYALSDFTTRDQCRRVVERISRHSDLTELEVAQRAVSLAAQAKDERTRHTAYYLLADGVEQLEGETRTRVPSKVRFIRGLRARATGAYIGSVGLLTISFLSVSLALGWEAGVREPLMLAVLGALALFPLSELSLQIVNALVISLMPPEPLPKMDFRDGIPREHATLVVVPMMLSNLKVVTQEVEKLEVRFLANREPNLSFALLSDFNDSPEPTLPSDEELLQAAKDGIAALNVRYPERRFLLFQRDRMWSPSERLWIGRERKRGKIEDLNQFLCGGGSAEILAEGRLALPTRYVITLDADTQLPSGTARRMVETISHPLNRVEIDERTQTRRRGYAIIQPRVSIGLPGATATRFTRVFADTAGTDPYCRTVSDAQQDLFGEAIFHGKAIYDVQAFRTVLETRFPAETLLSHDLIEGAHTGVGLASDIELFENLPRDYASFSKRQHRWIRGDWQIAPWIFSRVPSANGGLEANPLSFMNRWRILDNLRRSLVPIASLLLLLFGWLISAAPGIWSLVVGLAVAIPAMAPLIDRFARRLQGSMHNWQGAPDDLERAAVLIAFLPHQAWLSLHAIASVAYRRNISHRHLLEWQPAEQADSHRRRSEDSTLRQMLAISGVSLVLMAILHARGAFAPTSAFLALWVISPLILLWLARAVVETPGGVLDRTDILFLRRLARRTWRYFDDLVNAESNWLPPDNSQLALRLEVAARTSPTNIGLWLSAALAAADFGYLTLPDLLKRCGQTLATLQGLERYEGHLLNWYDTKTLQPLMPRYVSTVDSGNLLASLWVFEKGCQDHLHAPLLGTVCLKGLSDTLSALREAGGRDPSLAMAIHALRPLLRGHAEGHLLVGRLRVASNPMQQLQSLAHRQEAGDERTYWISRLSQELTAWIEIVDRYLPWIETLTHPPDSFLQQLGNDVVKLRRTALLRIPSLQSLAKGNSPGISAILAWRGRSGVRPEICAWLDQLAGEYEKAQKAAHDSVRQFDELCTEVRTLAGGINMRFLYDPNRRLFGIGYAVGGPVEFTSHYDLLASECRLASLVSIAKGDVPVEHWFALSRPQVSASGGRALLSWSGTMFEYLMPLLFMRAFSNSLLDHACREAVRLQIRYGRDKDVPWGVSEAAYSALDTHQIYQYRAFGIPALALKPALEDDLVVAPYASMLALTVDSKEAIDNLRRLQSLELDGPMGFYESIDYSRESDQSRERGVTIYAYMAHHQAMSLLALDDVLHAEVMRHRFHADVRIRAVESLLYERAPSSFVPAGEVETVVIPARSSDSEEPAERTWTETTAVPRVHLQGNGGYSLMVTNAGGGYSRWNGFDLTRWRSDATRDGWGSFLYIRDSQSEIVWSASAQPVGGKTGSSSVSFSADHAQFRRRAFEIETVLDVAVAPDDDVELRRLTVTNRSGRSRRLEFTSYLELALAPHRADAFHPAFAKMFVETEHPAEDILLARHRLRSPEDPPVWAAHLLVGHTGPLQYETDRAMFLGRGGDTSAPTALGRNLSGTIGAVLDPIFSLRCRAALPPRQRLELVFVTLAASSREGALALADKYRRQEQVSREFEMAWTRTQLEFRYLGIGPASAHRFQELASHLLYPNWRMRPHGDKLSRNRLGQAALWTFGISGDLPMLLVTASEPRHLSLIREVLLAHTYWRLRGFLADLIILNQEAPGYDRPFHQQLLRQVEARSPEAGFDKPGGVFLRDWHSLAEEHRDLLLEASSVVIHGGRGSLQQQLAVTGEVQPPPAFVPSGGSQEVPSVPLPFLELPYFNGLGGLTADGREYATYLKPGSQTPAPWANIMASPGFGALVTESGLGFTWNGNSQTNRLTPWHNDPVSDPQSEAIYIRDEESGALWTPTPLPIREQDAYRARHGQGYTVFEHNSHAVGQELTVFVPVETNGSGDPVKIYRLRLRNDSGRTRRLSITFYAEWVLGGTREDEQLHVQTSRDHISDALIATQQWTGSYTSRIAFAAATPKAGSFSGDRTQFLGRNGSPRKPAGLSRARLDNRVGAGLDPAAILQVALSVSPGEQSEVVFLLGETDTVESMRELVGRYRNPEQVERSLNTLKGWWDSRLGSLQVRTPILSTNFLLNRWLPYQTLSCRFWGRSGLYQSSGAFGFRDQLQDCLGLLYMAPELVRAHILTAAARQFPEGDVQHWWHPETGVGVRSRCSDDMLWLPFVVAHYVEVTEDASIFQEEIPFIEGDPLKNSEDERVFTPTISTQTASLWEHCRRALERAWQLGPQGLPLIGTGDWNDGLNRVGIQGRGESVWLGWFLCSVLQSWARLAETRSPEHAVAWRERAGQLANTMDRVAWDGEWFLRAFFDDGTPLGSRVNKEARIDSIAQSWAVICGAADPLRARRAMESAQRELVKDRDRLVLLFTPPFDHSEPHPGYIMGYPPGVRENGGQYTHGSLWMASAWARLGEGEAAVHLLNLMNPVESSRDPQAVERFRGEPYVSAADVSSSPGRAGRAGWTWYTGSAAWMYRIWIEDVLGFQLRGDRLAMTPVIPEDWPGFEIAYRYRTSAYEISVRRRPGNEGRLMELDGREFGSNSVPLVDDGAIHKVTVWIPTRRLAISAGEPPGGSAEASESSMLRV
ncbi:MAG TPA: glucoamylase family protein [Bryobacteraceae bacterium]|jgi:cyclic beta-1,2-glucan synthetase